MKNSEYEIVEVFYSLLANDCGLHAIEFAESQSHLKIKELETFLSYHRATEYNHASICPRLLQHHTFLIGRRGGTVNPIYGRDDFVKTSQEILSEKLSEIFIKLYDGSIPKEDVLKRYQSMSTLKHRIRNAHAALTHMEDLIKSKLGVSTYTQEMELEKIGQQKQSSNFKDKVKKAKALDLSMLA